MHHFLKSEKWSTFKLNMRIILFLALLSVQAFAGEVKLPSPTGQYRVGTKAFEVADPDRTMLRGKQSRRWMVQAYYPTLRATSDALGRTYPYMPGTLENGEVRGQKVLAWSSPEGPVLPHSPLPVLLFMHGFGEIRQSYTIICEELASQGYAVLSLDLPYVSNFTKFQDGTTIVPTAYDSWKSGRDRDYRYQYYDEAMAAAMADIRFMLDHFQSINQNHFSGELDSSRIAIMGHSFGGNVAHTLGFEDHRIGAVIDLDSKITDRKIYGRIGVPLNSTGKPVLFVRGVLQYQEDVGDSLTKITNATIKNFSVQHSAFRDIAFLARKIDGMKSGPDLVSWFFKTGPQFDVVDIDLGGQDVDAWFQLIRKTLVEWLHSQYSSSKLLQEKNDKAGIGFLKKGQ